MPTAIGAYAAAGPVCGNVPPTTIDLAVTPGVCSAPPSAPETVNASAAIKATALTMSFRTDLSSFFPSELLPVSRERSAAEHPPLGVRPDPRLTQAYVCCERLGLVELGGERVDPALPDAWVGEIEADHLGELLRRLGAARAKELEVRLDHRVAFELVPAEDREGEQEAVRVRVDVARRAHEVRDVAPPRLVAVDVDRVADHPSLRLEPELLQTVGRELAFLTALGVHDVLEAVQGDLPEHGRDRVLDPPGEQVQPAARVVLEREQPLEGQGLAEDR